MSYKVNSNYAAIEDSIALFQPDILLPAQYFDTFRRNSFFEPEKTLMLAVLEDGLRCFQEHLAEATRRGKRLFREAEEWIFEYDSEWFFAFENICEVLGINPHYIRGQLLRWKEMKLAPPSKTKVHRLNLGQRRNKRWASP
ncbi:MAG TPA: hypothetical protein VMO00_04570 [Methylomirabilota bacterium]|nr:hypothetical protein [Methylomirabilota bacterium]